MMNKGPTSDFLHKVSNRVNHKGFVVTANVTSQDNISVTSDIKEAYQKQNMG